MKNNSGFTLIEVILALSIFSIIGVLIINMLSEQINAKKNITALNNSEHSLNAALNCISQDLEGAYIADINNSTALNLSHRAIIPKFIGSNNNLVFFTMAFQAYLAGTNESNQAYIRYYLKTNEQKKELIRIVDTNFIDDINNNNVGFATTLLDNIADFKLEYWNGNQFVDTWDSSANTTQNKLPKLVKINLASYADEKSTLNKKNAHIYKLNTIVYLTNTKGQKEAITPTWTKYLWQ